MKLLLLCATLAGLLLAGCGGNNAEPVRDISQIKGKPILQEKTNVVATTPAATNTIAAPVALKTTNAAPAAVNGYLQVGFDKLASFHYIMPDESTNALPPDQFPPTVKAFDQKPVALRGFMLPLRVDQGLVTEMLIMRDQSMCCYGTSPKITEWVSVKMNEKGVKPVMDQPVTLFGKLHVGEQRENGYLVGIYQMDGDKMEWE